MMFQDVIMAVFGILILIVIYLLINAKVSDIEFVQALEEMREEKASLNDSIQVAEAKRDELYDNAIKVIESRENFELQKQVKANQGQIEAFDNETQTLLAEVEAQTEALDETISERFEKHPGVVSARDAVLKQQAEIETLKNSIGNVKLDAEKTVRIIETTKSYLDEIGNQFRVEIDESLAGESVYLVDFGGRQIRAFRIYNGEQETIESNSAEDLLKKVQADTEKKRVFFFVRPDAVEEFNSALLDFRESKIPVGFQPVPAGEELILTKFPEGIPVVDGQAGSGVGGVAESEDGGRGGEAITSSGANASGAQEENQTNVSETTGDGDTSGGAAGDESESGQANSSSQSDAADQAASGSEMVGDGEAPESGDWTFKWWILLLLLVLILIIFIIVKGSKR